MRAMHFGSLALFLVACAGSANDADSSSQDQTAAAASLGDGQNLTYQQLAAAVPGTGATSAAIVFPSTGDPAIYGQLVAGGKVTVLYALNRLSQCRATHDGYQIWDTRLGGEFSEGTKVGEELGVGANGQPQGSLEAFPGGTMHTAVSAPLTFDVPVGAESLFLYAHNTSPAGPSPACDAYDSKSSANFQFEVAGNAAVGVDDGSGADADALSQLVDIGDGTTTAAILFGASGAPVVKGNLVQGGKVVVAFALDRLPQCRALHDGYPYWVTQMGGQFDDGTKVGEASADGAFFDDATKQPGHVVRFTPVANAETPKAQAVATVFDVPASAAALALWAHNWNPGGPVAACSAYDSLNGANYHFTVQSR